LQARVLERHRLSDQVFLPLGGARRCVLLLAPAAIDRPRAEDCVALLTDGQQGICIAAGTWHHGLLALDDGPWAVLERRAAAQDCDEATLDMPVLLAL
jgi:ureidoglycolate lyase